MVHRENQLPRENQILRENQVHRENQLPREDKVPIEDNIPREDKVPEDNLVPREYQIPWEDQVPRENQIPRQDQKIRFLEKIRYLEITVYRVFRYRATDRGWKSKDKLKLGIIRSLHDLKVILDLPQEMNYHVQLSNGDISYSGLIKILEMMSIYNKSWLGNNRLSLIIYPRLKDNYQELIR